MSSSKLREAALARRGIYAGVDLLSLAKKLWALEAMRSEGGLPRIHFATRSSSYTSGRAWSRQLTLRIGMDSSVEDVVEVLLHELVHCACPRRTHHGELFCRRLIACANECFDLDLVAADLLALPRGSHKNLAYAIDRAIRDAMISRSVREKFLQLAPARLEFSCAAKKRAARSEARALHAESMLAAWEKKLKTAERLVMKWKKRASYYRSRPMRELQVTSVIQSHNGTRALEVGGLAHVVQDERKGGSSNG